MQDLLAALIAFFLVEPIQREIAETLANSRAPQEVVTSIRGCVTEHGPQIVNRALGDPWWATSSIFGVWVGIAEPAALLAEGAPGCVAALEAAQPYFDAQEGSGV